MAFPDLQDLAGLLEEPDLRPLDLSLGQAGSGRDPAVPAAPAQAASRPAAEPVPTAATHPSASSPTAAQRSGRRPQGIPAFKAGFLQSRPAKQQPSRQPSAAVPEPVPASSKALSFSAVTGASRLAPELADTDSISPLEEAAAGKEAFAALRPVCTKLMQPRIEAGEAALLLGRLQQVLAEQSPVGLRCCLTYTLLPLMYLVDSAAACRTGEPAACACSCVASRARR